MPGFFVMIDGLDGSGKGTALDALKEWTENILKKKVLDLRIYWKEHNTYPESIEQYDVIISAEPTYLGIGKKIREEMIVKNQKKYSPEQIAEAFAADRDFLYKEVIIPALKKGKWIFQERGIVTSIVYQPLQGITLEKVKSLPGNKQALNNAPNVLIVTKIRPEATMQRLAERTKQDNAMFENLEFQKKLEGIYESAWLKELFEQHGSEVVYLDTNPPLRAGDTKRKIIEIVEERLSTLQK
ncbi:hypothetical protein J4457_04745 [Candidatus Woesearchaeota archaeon]|nr:hypothetical protein [Candidatus Woesearchaeota archaeon]